MQEEGLNFIAVEGDFDSLYQLNRYVKNLAGAANSVGDILIQLDKWPSSFNNAVGTLSLKPMTVGLSTLF